MLEVHDLTVRYEEPSARLAEQLRLVGYPLPGWLSDAKTPEGL